MNPVDYTKLTPEQRREIRNKYIDFQKGLCYYCGHKLSEPTPKHITSKKITRSLYPKNFFDCPIHLQHNHDTGMTEGAVHNYCNAVLWEYHGR